MTRWIRFLTIFLGAYFRPKADAGSVISLKFWTWLTEGDVGYINNASFLSYTELGRFDFLVRSRLLFSLLKEGIYFPVATAHILFVRPVRRIQRLEMRTRLAYWDSKWIWVEQEIYFKKNGQDVLAMRSLVKNTFRKGRVVVPFEDLLRGIGMSLFPMVKPEVIAHLERVDLANA